jgi:hypothetical protein
VLDFLNTLPAGMYDLPKGTPPTAREQQQKRAASY